MKFIRYYLIFSSYSILLLLLFSEAEAQELEDLRVAKIEARLRSLSDSIMPGLNETANFSVTNASLQDFLRGVAETHNLNVSIDPSVDIRISNNFTNVQVLNLLVFLCKEYNLEIRFVGAIISFYKFSPPAPEIAPLPPKRLKIDYDPNRDLLTADLANDSLTSFAKQATQITKKNIVLSPGLQGRMVSGYIENLPFDVALDKIAYSNNLRLLKTEDKTFVLQSNEVQNFPGGEGQNGRRQYTRPARQGDISNPNQGGMYIDIENTPDGQKLITVDAVNVPIVDIINDVSEKTGQEYILFSEIKGNTTASIRRVNYDNFLNHLLRGTSHAHKLQDSVYLIGERNLEGLRTSRLVKMQYRSVDTLETVIPAELKKGVEIKVFSELNSIILTGGSPQIAEIVEFLKALDQPVVNVLIEVMVVEINKSHSISTGIKAGLADSAVATSGSLFPGLNLTLSSGAINSILNQLPKGASNIGKVTPNFYVALRAEEENNNVKIRSTPKLSTLNGHKASLVIGEKQFYLQETQNITGGVTPIQTGYSQWEPIEANLKIDINPLVSGDDNITLTINAEFSNFVDPISKPSSSTRSVPPPGTATRMFNSMIRVKNEDMIVLGGLEYARNSNGGSGTPFLSRIPVIKWLFSSRSKQKTDNRLVVFIKPTLVY